MNQTEIPAAKPKTDGLRRVSAAIIKYRYLIFLLFALAAVYCALSVGKVRINSDLTAFLPSQAETRRGLSVMEDEFITYASANVMVSNITFATAEEIAAQLGTVAHVSSVAFDDTPAHFVSPAALFSVSFDGGPEDAAILDAMAELRTLVSAYDHYISSDVGQDFSAHLASEMAGVIGLAALVILAVLLFTSRSWFEVVIFGIVFVAAALLNMGTNFWLGEISSITNSIAIILQLALAIDYAIIFAHRYQDEAAVHTGEREALVEALAKSIVEISSSSLTTISGLAALTLMQFRLGRDLGLVLSKGIICSMITVFLLMPGLILLFPRALRLTQHRTLVPDIHRWGELLVRSKYCFAIIFALLLPFAIYFSSRTEYAFADSSIDELVYSESREAAHRIDSTFAPDTTIAVLVPGGSYASEKAILTELAALPEIKTATGLANIEVAPGQVLTDSFTPRMFAELVDIDIEQAQLLFQAYGLQHEQYQALFGAVSSYEVPLVDMFLYLFEKMDQGIVSLEGAQAKRIGDLRATLERGVSQLRGESRNRLVLTAAVPVEGADSTALVETVRRTAERYYGEGQVLVVGNITSARDLRDSYNSDSLLISLLTIVFVFVILLFTFRSLMAAVVLVFVIQGSIWINFSFPTLQGMHPSFVTNMIVSAIQMGATIDYAIVLMSRYLALKQQLPKREAMSAAVNESFPTILTSGTIMTVAGLLIAFRISDVYVGHIGLAIGRGALISVILVLTVLPQIIILFDRAIEKTKFELTLDSGDERG